MDKLTLALNAVKGGMSVKTAAKNYGLTVDELNEAITRELLPNKQPHAEVQEESWLTKAKNYISDKIDSFFVHEVEITQSGTTPLEDIEKNRKAREQAHMQAEIKNDKWINKAKNYVYSFFRNEAEVTQSGTTPLEDIEKNRKAREQAHMQAEIKNDKWINKAKNYVCSLFRNEIEITQSCQK